jgi:hypothetical protein
MPVLVRSGESQPVHAFIWGFFRVSQFRTTTELVAFTRECPILSRSRSGNSSEKGAFCYSIAKGRQGVCLLAYGMPLAFCLIATLFQSYEPQAQPFCLPPQSRLHPH